MGDDIEVTLRIALLPANSRQPAEPLQNWGLVSFERDLALGRVARLHTIMYTS